MFSIKTASCPSFKLPEFEIISRADGVNVLEDAIADANIECWTKIKRADKY
jgi:hypothetical protein